MRILSQDLKFDIEYENCHLVVNDKCFEIEAETSNPNFTPVMASYSSIEKCRKAMEMLRNIYTYGKQVALPKINEDEIAKDDEIGLFNAQYFNKNRFFNVSEKYFQFPADDEIEV